ncbi:hypothetical protein [Streptomyces syringium]|uniref:hypothetical protein n=1 Tax=Streptomyces syringium TaxID=76729 RepID=UPI00345630C2
MTRETAPTSQGTSPSFFPYVDDSFKEIYAFYAKDTVGIRVQVMSGIVFLLYLWFVAGFLELTRVAGRSRILNRATGWAAVCCVLLTLMTYVFWALPVFWLNDDAVHTSLVVLVYYVAVAVYLFLFLCLALFMTGSGLLVLRTGVLPRWLGVSALVVAVPNAAVFSLFFVTSGPLRPVSLLMFTTQVLVCGWVAVTGIHMVRYSPENLSPAAVETGAR